MKWYEKWIKQNTMKDLQHIDKKLTDWLRNCGLEFKIYFCINAIGAIYMTPRYDWNHGAQIVIIYISVALQPYMCKCPQIACFLFFYRQVVDQPSVIYVFDFWSKTCCFLHDVSYEQVLHGSQTGFEWPQGLEPHAKTIF